MLRSGKLTFSPAFSLDCRIRDESESGARIHTGGAALPRAVVLVSVTRRIAHEAQVVWRHGEEAGVKLGARYELDPTRQERSDPLRHAQVLWSYANGLSYFAL